MQRENIVDVEADEETINELLQSETVTVGTVETPLSDIISDIQTAHKGLDEYKSGSMSLAKTLSEAADETDDEVLTALFADLSDGAFTIYLRLQRGDMELLGDRNGEYSGFLKE